MKFLAKLKRTTLPLGKLLEESNSQVYHLGLWLKNPRFVRELKKVMTRRRQIHRIAQELTRFCAIDKLAERLGQAETSFEGLRKTVEHKAKPTRGGAKIKAERPSFAHPDLSEKESAELKAQLNA